MIRDKKEPLMEGNVRRESSVPVQGRISIVDLARLCKYWEMVENVEISSMSKLLSWSVSALSNLLNSHGKVPEGIDSVADAHRYLIEKGLYQRSLGKRSMKKISTAIMFETLRDQGIDTRELVPRSHVMVNNKHSVEPFDVGSVYEGVINADDVEMARKMIERQKAMNGDVKVEVELSEEEKKEKEARKVELNNTIKAYRETGKLPEEPGEVQKNVLRSNMTESELDEYNKVREEEVAAKENAPVNVEEIMKLQAARNV